ncbi:MAG: hypothetical protein Kow0029_01260 [Candidatus Rifleibacteriota bacterium]
MAEAETYSASEMDLAENSLSLTSSYFSRPKLVKLLSGSKKIVLTFDDGPHPRTTPAVLEILRKRNIKAIFFVLGLQAEKYPDLIMQIHAEGHEIGNHSYNHKNMAQLTEEKAREQIEKTNSIVEAITGEKPKYFRPPYGALNQQVVKLLREENMNIMLWTVDPKDWQNKNTATIIRNLEKQLGLNGNMRGGAVLLHDIYPATVRALDPFLDKLSSNEYLISNSSLLDSTVNNFWAAKAPELLRDAKFKRSFNPELSGNNLLVNYLEPEKSKELSSMAMLKASRNGELLVCLFKNGF